MSDWCLMSSGGGGWYEGRHWYSVDDVKEVRVGFVSYLSFLQLEISTYGIYNIPIQEPLPITV